MEVILAQYQQLREYLRVNSLHFLKLANPDLDPSKTPTRDWPLARGEDALLLGIGYILFVFFGSLIMSFLKKGFSTARLKYIYNPLQVFLCAWMSLEAARQAYNLPNAKLVGNVFDPNRLSIASVLWWFYVSKVLDFLDTVFIILEKKWNQLSFLHVYHHLSIFLTYWVIINVGYDGDIYLTIVLNAFVHFVMYSYYMITTLGLYNPIKTENKDSSLYIKTAQGETKAIEGSDAKTEYRILPAKRYSPWWKSYVTVLQLVQFVVMNFQAIYMIRNDFVYPINIAWFYFGYIQSMFWLFLHFYFVNYCRKSSTPKPKKE